MMRINGGGALLRGWRLKRSTCVRPECRFWGACESGSGDLAGELSQALSLPRLCCAAVAFIVCPVFSVGYTAL